MLDIPKGVPCQFFPAFSSLSLPGSPISGQERLGAGKGTIFGETSPKFPPSCFPLAQEGPWTRAEQGFGILVALADVKNIPGLSKGFHSQQSLDLLLEEFFWRICSISPGGARCSLHPDK